MVAETVGEAVYDAIRQCAVTLRPDFQRAVEADARGRCGPDFRKAAEAAREQHPEKRACSTASWKTPASA